MKTKIVLIVSLVLIVAAIVINMSRQNNIQEDEQIDTLTDITVNDLEDIPVFDEPFLLGEEDDSDKLPETYKNEIDSLINDITRDMNSLNYENDFEDFGSLE